ncbi:MAG: OB-fold domain-containing protein, partial [Ilumatobacteraceae bacterium]
MSSGVPTPLLPVDDDHDTGGFFEAARRGELVVRACSSCGTLLHLPRAFCHRCGSWDGEWRPVAGTGTLHTWTVVDHQVHPAYPVPYTIVLVDLDDAPGVRLLGHLPGSPDLQAGMPMRVRFD